MDGTNILGGMSVEDAIGTATLIGLALGTGILQLSVNIKREIKALRNGIQEGGDQ
jgi:protein involved in polysaccharide export with SLBB domain